MSRKRDYDKTAISFTLTKAGCSESAPVELTGREFSDLLRRIKGRVIGPKTKAQAETSALFEEFVRRGMGK